ncbi:MAG: hypothetical protein E7653_04610 [Ruminococcaceae bacterium]|nr:hypothetical protein [Oscillospiraceae bacterium]
MKKTVIKAALAVVLILTMLFSLAACGNTSAKIKDAESASGAVGATSLTWNYDKESKTLSINGSGAMPDFESAEAVSWYAVRHSVEKVVVADGITNVGNYAFYYSPKLTNVQLPASVTSIGKLSFAFCSTLESIALPTALTSIGDSCFEGCAALKSIFVPASVNSIGARAFAYCGALESASLMAHITEIKDETFKNCKALKTLVFSSAAKDIPVAANAFENAAKSYANAEFLVSDTGEATLTIKYVYEDGREANPTYTAKLALGANYSVNSPVIDTYTASVLTVSGTITKDTDVEVKYTPTPTETEPADATTEPEPEAPAEDDKGIGVGTIIAIVIFAIVLVAIVVFAVFMIRSDKKAKETAGKPVRKDDKNGKDKKGGNKKK